MKFNVDTTTIDNFALQSQASADQALESPVKAFLDTFLLLRFFDFPTAAAELALLFEEGPLDDRVKGVDVLDAAPAPADPDDIEDGPWLFVSTSSATFIGVEDSDVPPLLAPPPAPAPATEFDPVAAADLDTLFFGLAAGGFVEDEIWGEVAGISTVATAVVVVLAAFPWFPLLPLSLADEEFFLLFCCWLLVDVCCLLLARLLLWFGLDGADALDDPIAVVGSQLIAGGLWGIEVSSKRKEFKG